ncbi:MAG: D-glycero-beta-D-manno-heptose 1,7-bisphosphate 7-phosphatase [Gammaproteobacteria bacterium]|nr:D-glycero-beta-D-manno-heptose 1,7-bisphosphate 7-phosphatase [Gammaproteobacteria bacterium]
MRLVILDRDGVINEDSDDFIKSPEEWLPIPGSLEAITRLCREDYRVVLATNQSGIARGLFDMDTLNQIHLRMLDQIRQKGGEIDAIFFCPHGPDDHCDCRKPKAGMFRDIADRLHINMTGVPAVGDSLRDIQAARAVNALPVLVRTGKGQKTLDNMSKHEAKGVVVFEDLYGFSEALLTGQLVRRISDVIAFSGSHPAE